MRKKFHRLPSRAAWWSPKLGGVAIVVLILIILSHRFAFIDTRPFFIGCGLVASLSLAGLACAIRGLGDLWARGDKGGKACIKGMILSFFALAPLIFVAYLWLIFPAIYDISSDPDNPPPQLSSLGLTGIRPENALPLLDDFSAQIAMQRKAWPNLSGRRYDSSPDVIVNAVEAVFEMQDWQVNIPPIMEEGEGTDTEGENFLTSVAYIPLLGFASDIIVRLKDEDESTVVDMRVIARDLPHDFGLGADYILHFMQALDREVLFGNARQILED